MSKNNYVESLVSQAIGIPVRHYRNPTKTTVFHHMTTDFGESNTDKSTYRPDLSLARAYQGAQNKRLIYDFNDGKDNGQTVQTFIRSPGLDVTEIDTATQRITQIIEDKKTKDKESIKNESDKKQFIKELSDSVKSSSAENTQNTTE